MNARTPLARRLTAVALALGIAVAGAALAGCGGGSGGGDRAAGSAGEAGTDPPATPPTIVARADAALDVRAEPDGAEVIATLPPTTTFGSPRALGVLEQRDGWLHVAVPVRPNGTTGWVPADGVQLVSVSHALTVDLAARTLTLTDAGEVVLTTPVAIGTEEFPTPTGTFYVVDKLDTGDDGGAYGPIALGLSGFSDVLTEFAGGDGQVGIHGTNDPGTIGEAVSHGCVRVPNDVIVRLAEELPLGTPVTIA
jgi:lipoprotein-anchoring transpeptidase ErfK/SrfK